VAGPRGFGKTGTRAGMNFAWRYVSRAGVYTVGKLHAKQGYMGQGRKKYHHYLNLYPKLSA